MADSSLTALRQLRRTRQLHRLGNIEWFDAAYRAYIVGIFGGGSVLWISSSIKDSTVSAATAADFAAHAPAVLGLVAAFALLAGLRSGAQGGPLALEAADVVHVMLSPVDRRRALNRPAVQRLRSALFAGVTAGAIVGQLAGRRLPGSLTAWAAGGALYGATVAAIWVGSSLVAHTLRAPRWVATALGLATLGWQAAAVAWHVPGPANQVGSLGLWGWRQHPIDLVAPIAAVAALVVGFALLRRISLDALARRSALVAQLRFAVTMQDLRTVILLRRQLNQEHTRARPWAQLRPAGRSGMSARFGQSGESGESGKSKASAKSGMSAHPGRIWTATVWRRGWHSLLRFPVPRLVRMTALAAGIGVLQAATVRGTTPAFIGAAILAFVLGLEVMEPLSQEVDQPDWTDSMPVERGELMVRHLAAPAVALVPFAVVAAAAAVIALGLDGAAIAPAAIMAYPVLLGGVAGGVVSIVRDAPDPLRGGDQQTFVPPEMAGISTTVRLLWPIVVSALGTSTVLLPRQALVRGDSTVPAAIRGALGSLLVAAAVTYWVKVRDQLRRRIRAFLDEGRSHTAAQRSQQRSPA